MRSSTSRSLFAYTGSLFLAVCAAIVGTAQAAGPSVFQLKDFNGGTTVRSSSPSAFGNIPWGTLFVATDVVHGKELWRTDGTTASLLKDVNPGIGDGAAPGVVSGSYYFFPGSEPSTGLELWRSDAISSQTFLVKDINSGPNGSSISNLTNVNGTLYFTADDGTNGLELWKSDGTSANTTMVKDICVGSCGTQMYALTASNSKLFFLAQTSASGRELWASDGTAANTAMVKDICIGTCNAFTSPSALANLNGTVYFAANDGSSGYELWKSDGTGTGTTLVKDIYAGAGNSWPSSFAVAGSMLYFSALDASGVGVWKSDGTGPGTTRIATVCTGSTATVSNLTAVGSNVFFTMTNCGAGSKLWVTNGTTVTGLTGSTYPSNLIGMGSSLYFSAAYNGYELWKSDGTTTGTVQVLDICPGSCSSYPRDFAVINSQLFFSATDATGAELWKSNGTAAGTLQVANINPDAGDTNTGSFFPGPNGTAVFNGFDTVDGPQPAISDGTMSGTHILAVLNPGNTNPSALADEYTLANGTLYFRASTPGHGRELWKSDGTPAGTTLVKDLNGTAADSVGELEAMNGLVFFSGNDGINSQLWMSNGTESGTVPVSPGTAAVNPTLLTTISGSLYFTSYFQSLWKVDGASLATSQLAPVKVDWGIGPSIGGRIYFPGDDGSTGDELWSTDGTAAGTALVKNIRTGAGDGVRYNLAALGSTLILAANDGVAGNELWKSDGTSTGTVLVKDINPGLADSMDVSVVGSLAAANGLALLAANDGTSGTELWKTDGSLSGTVQVKDICPGVCSGVRPPLISIGTHVYFLANDGIHGEELWRSDGSSAGTVMVADVEPGSGGSNPQYLSAVGNLLYFRATTASAGSEPWVACDTATYRLSLSTPLAVALAAADSVTVTPLDSSLKRVPCYGGTIHFTSSDPLATLPGDYTFTAGQEPPALPFSLSTLGPQTITATDIFNGSILGARSITVTASPVTSTISSSAAAIVANGTSTALITVQLKDGNGANITSGSVGLVLNTTLGTLSTPVNNGNGTYTATLHSATVTGTAVVSGTLDGLPMSSHASVALVSGPAATLTVVAPDTVNAASPFDVTVTARDANGNVAGTYGGTVHFSVNDSSPVLPTDYAFQPADNGVHTFTGGFTLRTIGNRIINATDTLNGSVSGLTLTNVHGLTTTVVTSAPSNPANPGVAVTLTATVSTAALGATLTGNVVFRDGAATLGTTAISGGIASLTTSALASGPHSITAVYSGDTNFSGSTSSPFTQYITLPAPALTVSPSASSPWIVSIYWSAVANAAAYQVLRGSTVITTTAANVTTFADSSVQANTAYVYSVRALDSGGNPGFSSTKKLATTYYMLDAVYPGTLIKASKVNDLRYVIQLVRAAAGLPDYSYTRPTLAAGMVVTAADFMEMRAALDAARTVLGLSALSYSRPTLTPGVTVIKAVDWAEIYEGTGSYVS